MIATYEHQYPVICVSGSAKICDSYICRGDHGGGLYEITAIKDKRYFPEIIGYLTSISDKETFADNTEYFICGDRLCIVMRSYKGMTLEEKLRAENMTISERLEIGRGILERIAVLDIPDYFLTKCCDTKNIVIDRGLAVYFNYPIGDIASAGKYTRSAALACVEDVLRELFANELRRGAPSALTAFFSELLALSEDGGIVGVCGAYHKMMSHAAERGADEEPETVWFAAWEKIKTAATILRGLLMAAILLAALTFLFYTIINVGGEAESSSNFDSIGTVEITIG